MRSAVTAVAACVSLFLLAGSGAYETVAGQTVCDDPTGDCDLSPTGYHSFPDGANETDHYTCEWEECHDSTYVGHCGDKHWACDDVIEGLEVAQVPLLTFLTKSELSSVDYSAAIAAFRAAEAAGIAQVRFNEARGAWQLLSCKLTTVIAHLPITGSLDGMRGAAVTDQLMRH